MANNQTNPEQNHFDIIIVGAGVVGSALALALSKSDLSIALLDSQVLGEAQQKPIEDLRDLNLRVSALSAASENNLKAWGAWEHLNLERCQPYESMNVWDEKGNANVELNAAEVSASHLGVIVENDNILHAIHDALETSKTVQRIQGERLCNIEQAEDQLWYLTSESQQRFCSRLLIAADGGNSFVRGKLKLPTREWSYPHHALVTAVQTELPHQNTAWQIFRQAGPLAFLPIANKETDNSQQKTFASIVWSLTESELEKVKQLDDDEFCKALGDAFEHRLGNVLACHHRVSFDLNQKHAVDYVRQGLALVGDAAHVIHPLAGQGMNLGLKDAQALSEEILYALERGGDWASEATMLRYQRRRKGHNLSMMAGMEALSRMFGGENLGFNWLRNIGMRTFAKHTLIKRKAIKWAMGIQ